MQRARILMATIIVIGSIGSTALAKGIENLARNGDFEDGTVEWDIRTSEGTVATIEEDDSESIKGRYSVFIQVEVAKGTTWHISLFQEGHSLKGGNTYTLAAWAKGVKPRPMSLYIEQAADPWNEFGNKDVTITEEWAEYWTTFKAVGNTPAAWIRIGLGQAKGDLWVDNVRFYVGEYEEDEELGRKLAVNPAGKLATSWASIKRQ